MRINTNKFVYLWGGLALLFTLSHTAWIYSTTHNGYNIKYIQISSYLYMFVNTVSWITWITNLDTQSPFSITHNLFHTLIQQQQHFNAYRRRCLCRCRCRCRRRPYVADIFNSFSTTVHIISLLHAFSLLILLSRSFFSSFDLFIVVVVVIIFIVLFFFPYTQSQKKNGLK